MRKNNYQSKRSMSYRIEEFPRWEDTFIKNFKNELSIYCLMNLKGQLKNIYEKKNKKYNEIKGLYKYTKLPEDIINKILEYNY